MNAASSDFRGLVKMIIDAQLLSEYLITTARLLDTVAKKLSAAVDRQNIAEQTDIVLTVTKKMHEIGLTIKYGIEEESRRRDDAIDYIRRRFHPD